MCLEQLRREDGVDQLLLGLSCLSCHIPDGQVSTAQLPNATRCLFVGFGNISSVFARMSSPVRDKAAQGAHTAPGTRGATLLSWEMRSSLCSV